MARWPEPHTNWQAATCIELLDLRPEHHLVDVGGGGDFALLLRRSVGAEPDGSGPVCGSLTVVDAGGPEAFASAGGGGGSPRFDRALLTETARRQPSGAERERLFCYVRQHQLVAGGRLLLVARDWDGAPHAAASTTSPAEQPVAESLAAELMRAGLVDVRVERRAYPLELLAGCRELRSSFSPLSEADLTRLLAAAPNGGSDESTLRFRDGLVLIHAMAPPLPSVATRPPAAALPLLPLGLRIACDGFAAPLPVLSSEEAARALSDLERYEAMQPEGRLTGDSRFKLHLLLPWAARLVRHPALLEAARAALGTADVLAWSCDVNDKAPGAGTFASPHQDSTYARLTPADQSLTAWLALSDAPREAGCLEFACGSHLHGQLPHDEATGAAHNMLAFGQTVRWSDSSGGSAEGGHGTRNVAAPLKAGEASLHFFRTVHWSAPNASARRRCGLAIRYVAATVGRSEGVRSRELATLVCGVYDPARGAFDLEPEPVAELGAAERAAHAEAMTRERENYFVEHGSAAAEYK